MNFLIAEFKLYYPGNDLYAMIAYNCVSNANCVSSYANKRIIIRINYTHLFAYNIA